MWHEPPSVPSGEANGTIRTAEFELVGNDLVPATWWPSTNIFHAKVAVGSISSTGITNFVGGSTINGRGGWTCSLRIAGTCDSGCGRSAGGSAMMHDASARSAPTPTATAAIPTA